MATSTGLLVLTELAGNPGVQLGYVQQVLSPYVQLLTYGWVTIWCVTGLYLLWAAFFRRRG